MSRRALTPRIAFCALATFATLAGPRMARAQDDAPFSERAHTVIVLDNLGGFVHADTSYPNSNVSTTSANVGGLFPFTPVARFGVHEFVAGGLSLGAGLIYSSDSQSLLGGLAPTLPAGTTFGIAPRVGYAFALSPTLALWARAGITYLNTGISGGGQFWQLSPGGEVFLVITPVSHFGITLGPFGEFGVAGQLCQGQNCKGQDIRENVYGITVGVLADF